VSLKGNALVVTAQGPNSSVIYIFRNYGTGSSGWVQKQRILPRAAQYDIASIAAYKESGYVGIKRAFPGLEPGTSVDPERSYLFSGGNYTLFGGGNFTQSNYSGATVFGGALVVSDIKDDDDV
jgi:hypothetical protein